MNTEYEKMLEIVVQDIEKTIKRKLDRNEIDSVRKQTTYRSTNTSSLALLESFSNEFYFARTDEELKLFIQKLGHIREYE